MGWPRGVPHHRTLTDQDLAAISATPPDVTTAALAERLGRPYFTVAHARQVLHRRGGWWTPIEIVACTECGAVLVAAPQRRLTAHPACSPSRAARYSRIARAEGRAAISTPYVAAFRRAYPERAQELRDQEKARMRESWPDLPYQERQTILAKAHAADQRDYPVTLAEASANGDRWTSDDEAYVLSHLREPARQVALTLGRTLWAVRSRRLHLRRRHPPR